MTPQPTERAVLNKLHTAFFDFASGIRERLGEQGLNLVEYFRTFSLISGIKS